MQRFGWSIEQRVVLRFEVVGAVVLTTKRSVLGVHCGGMIDMEGIGVVPHGVGLGS